MTDPADLASESSRTACPKCGAMETRLGTLTERFVYLRCGSCHEIWSIEERRTYRRLPADGSEPARVRAQAPRL